MNYMMMYSMYDSGIYDIYIYLMPIFSIFLVEYLSSGERRERFGGEGSASAMARNSQEKPWQQPVGATKSFPTKLLKMTIEIVDLPIENGDFP